MGVFPGQVARSMGDFTTLFSVNPSSGVPIYRQLIEQVLGLIASGRLRAGDELPSVRQLGAVLSVNFMTISKAWSRLEADGVVLRERGRGMVVQAVGGAGPTPQQQRLVRELMDQAVIRGVQCGLSRADLKAVFRASVEECGL